MPRVPVLVGDDGARTTTVVRGQSLIQPSELIRMGGVAVEGSRLSLQEAGVVVMRSWMSLQSQYQKDR